MDAERIDSHHRQQKNSWLWLNLCFFGQLIKTITELKSEVKARVNLSKKIGYINADDDREKQWRLTDTDKRCW